MGIRETRRESLVDLEADSRGSCPCCVGEWKGKMRGGDSDTITLFTSSVEEATFKLPTGANESNSQISS